MIEKCVFFDSSMSDNHNLEICDHEVFLAKRRVVRCTHNHPDKATKAYAERIMSGTSSQGIGISPADGQGHGDEDYQIENHSPSKLKGINSDDIIIPPNHLM
jgi:hypothetical protein